MKYKNDVFEEARILLEQLMKDNKDILIRLKEKDSYSIEDFLASFEHNKLDLTDKI